jgi:hypothetical protein
MRFGLSHEENSAVAYLVHVASDKFQLLFLLES